MRHALLLGLVALTLFLPAAAGAEAAAATEPPAPGVQAPQPFFAPEAAPAHEDCQAHVTWLTDGRHHLLPEGCSGHCYVEMTCPDGRYVGCYGGNSQACRQEGSYVVCDANYYSCDQCQSEQPFALGCEYC